MFSIMLFYMLLESASGESCSFQPDVIGHIAVRSALKELKNATMLPDRESYNCLLVLSKSFYGGHVS
jgi:hypothetical protein